MYTQIEQLISNDYSGKGIDNLYKAARALCDKPIIQMAAEMIKKVPKDGTVVLTTGSTTRFWLTPEIGETDGPGGVAALAKRIHMMTGALPVVFTEPTLVEPVTKVITAGGLKVLPLELARKAIASVKEFSTCPPCAVLPFTVNDEEAESEAARYLELLKPDLMISSEKIGRNRAGIYHNAGGLNGSAGRARIDHMFEMASERGIPTIGIGDGGNEIGMGTIFDAVRENVPYADKCRCGCGQGMAAVTKTDILLPCVVSNWGAQAICAAMAMQELNPELLHPAELEDELMRACLNAGLVDGATGAGDWTVDSFSYTSCRAILVLMNELAMRYIKKHSKIVAK
jgi:hypothetical protein